MIALFFVAGTVTAQEPETPATDAVDREATRLEAELGKYKETAPEAADVMAQLVDLYHGHARLFGLIRVGQKFAASHPGDQRHADVMLKLLDGLEATSRNEDFVQIARQFLQRYPKSPACPDVEVRLAAVLDEQKDRDASAVAHRVVFDRQGTSSTGLQHAMLAVRQDSDSGNKSIYTRGAELAATVLDRLPKGQPADEFGWQSFNQWRRGSEWARSNAVGSKMLAKGLPLDQNRKRQLLRLMGENAGNVGQWANAVNFYKQARAIEDDADIHHRLASAMYNNAVVKPGELAPVVADYTRKYPERENRFQLQSLLALVHERTEDKATANRLFAQLLPLDARTNSNAAAYVRTLPDAEPGTIAAAERTLRDAISKNPKRSDRTVLRYVLAFSIYRDRMKDDGKLRQTLRELVTDSPADDNETRTAVNWLLYNAPDEAQFRADLKRILESRQKHVHLASFRGRVRDWWQDARRRKEHRERAAIAKQALDAADQDPLLRAWIAAEPRSTDGDAGRENLINSPLFGKLTEEQKREFLFNRVYYLRHYAPGNQRARSTGAAGDFVKHFPKDREAAAYWLYTSTDYGPKEAAREAAVHYLGFPPEEANADVFRRLMLAADRNEDAALAKRSLAWILDAEKRFGLVAGYAYTIGDTLAKYEMENEAVAYWRSHVAVDRDQYDSMYLASRVAQRLEGAERTKFIRECLAPESDYHGAYATWLAADFLAAGDLDQFERTLAETRKRQDDRPFRGWGLDEGIVNSWVDTARSSAEMPVDTKRRVLVAVRGLDFHRSSASAELALLDLDAEEQPDAKPGLDRLLRYARTTQRVGDSYPDWDRLFPFVQTALGREDYLAAATLSGGLLANVPGVDEGRKKAGRDLVAQSYARMGTVGLTIDEDSPLAPLLQAALSLRLGDEALALEQYNANRDLFDEHRDEIPVDLVLFACENHIAAGGDANHDRVEDILRGWLVRFSESKQFDTATKARVQLLLAKNFARAQRYDVARTEYTTVQNRYPETPEAIEAEFGIGETFLAQKVFDQAEAVFDKLANSREAEIVVRAEFLRGVLSHRRGDRDEAREIFRGVLERVPNIELANRALFNLAEVYGDEERYVDQLNLLRTVGRLGRSSKRTHAPGLDLSIVVQDGDLGISRGHSRIPVIVRTEPGGDEETLMLTSGGAGKGLFRADLPTQLGAVAKGDGVLQVTGRDTVKCDYPDEFKQEFKRVPLSDVNIVVSADASFDVASSEIVDEEKETFSQRLEREAAEEEGDQRVSQNRPPNQVKPGNRIFLRVKDTDRDLGDQFEEVVVKLSAESGDELQVSLRETGPHTGVFEGEARTGELPAGALASDTAIEHSPLMAIDRNPDTYWMSEPDGATPKSLTIDTKDLRRVSRVTLSTPSADRHAPVRGELLGSDDGRFWFHLASNPPQQAAAAVVEKSGRMTRYLFSGNQTRLTSWGQIVNLVRDGTPFVEPEAVEELTWSRPEDAENPKRQNAAFAAVWDGKFVRERAGAVRFRSAGQLTAIAVDGRLELPIGPGGRSVDVWLESGTHDLTIFAATSNGQNGVSADLAEADHNSAQVSFRSFRAADFDLEQVFAREVPRRTPPRVDFGPTEWTMQFPSQDVRYVRFLVHEYVGEAVAISNVEVRGEDDTVFIPTEADVLALSTNDVLEIAGGDVVTATYTDEFTQREDGSGRLLTGTLTATYHNADVTPIAYDFERQQGGGIQEVRKRLMRIDPGERIVVEIVDFDMDQTSVQDKVRFDVTVNDGEPVEFTASETEPYSGIFRKEVDTSAEAEEDKLTVRPGDRVYLRYFDVQNTFPGHAVPRESVVYVNTPSEGSVRILETRAEPTEQGRPRVTVTAPEAGREFSRVAFEAPLTVEVVDPDRAKDDRSSVVVTLSTTDGATVDVECRVSSAFDTAASDEEDALEQGRFVGQVVLQLGGKASPSLVPITAEMPRNLVGGPVLDEEESKSALDRTLITRVLNVTGRDLVAAVYSDERRPEGEPTDRRATGRLITNGTLAVTDRDYDEPVERLHVGERLFVQVVDADRDATENRDFVEVEITSEFGERETVRLEETLAHSGVFTGSLRLASTEKPTPGNLQVDDAMVECYFGDTLHLHYADPAAGGSLGTLDLRTDIPVVVGTDGLVAAFTKTFEDESLAVETKFHIAESYFELFKSHKELGRKDEQRGDLQAGRRVLQEVMEDYPDPQYAPRVAYLLGQFAQELEQWSDAIASYRMIVQRYPEHALAPDAQYKLAQCYELSGDFDEALEAYVTLAATYPRSPLIASVMIRICDHFYKRETYDVAAQVGEKFLEKFEDNQFAPRIAFRVGQCYYKAKQYREAGAAFDDFHELFPKDTLAADSLFWAGESFRMGRNNREAFRRYNRCRWDHPASDAAKYARGRLALPEMLQQFEAEARSIENP